MGEMTIRLDDALLLEVESRARLLGQEPDRFVASLVRQAVEAAPRRDRTTVARELLALQHARSDLDGALTIRQDRDSR